MGGLSSLAVLAALAAAGASQDSGERVAAVVAALAGAVEGGEEVQPLLQGAWELFLEEHDAYRSDTALAVAEAMHAAAPAPWSAGCLEGILRRRGEYERADEVLERQIAATEDPLARRALVERRAILAGAAGWLDQERDLLGRALAEGGTDAWQMLARYALSAGERERARRLFRILVERSRGAPAEAAPWALRGWGLALLPVSPDPYTTATGGGG